MPYRTCCNCETYGWTFDRGSVQQCQRCKGVTYCSKICQLEHFNKVHKKHCKYYLGTKVKEASLHNPYACPKCVQMRAVGKGNMTLQEGSFVCIFDNQAYVTGVFQLQKNKKVKPPPSQTQIYLSSDHTLKEVPLRPGFLYTDLGEMNGKFSCEFERTVSLVSHIAVTIGHCINLREPPTGGSHQQGNVTANTMLQFRRYIWGCILESSSRGEFEWKSSYIFQHSVCMPNVMEEIESLAKDHSDIEQPDDDLKWFTTYILALNFLFIEDYAIHCRLKGRSVPHEEVRSSVLAAMATRLLPHSSLVALLCQGVTTRACSLCHEDTTVTAFFPSYPGFLITPEEEGRKSQPNLLLWAEEMVKGKSFVYLDMYGFTLYCCTNAKCLQKVPVLIQVTRARYNEEFARSENYPNGSHCAFCFKQCSGRPRCGGCKAKVYCSNECKDADWEVHELFCEALAKEKRCYRSKREIDQQMQERAVTQDDLVKNCSKVTESVKAIYDGVCNEDAATVADICKAVEDKLVLGDFRKEVD